MIDNHIAYCYSSEGTFSMSAFKKKTISNDEKSKLLGYLRNRAYVISASSGRITDAFTHETVNEYCAVLYSDGIFSWDSHDIYYFEKYDMMLREDFIQHALDRIKAA